MQDGMENEKMRDWREEKLLEADGALVVGWVCSVSFESRNPHEAMGVSDAMRSSVPLGEN